MRPLVVEFAGLPGSGKTTTAQLVVELLESRGYRCAYRPSVVRGRANRMIHRARFLGYRIRNWRLLVAALGYAASIRPFRLERLRSVEHLVWLSYYQSQQSLSQADVVLVDQSAIQTMWSTGIYGSEPGSDRVGALLKTFYRIARGSLVLIVFDLDAATAASRVVKRTRGPWRARFDESPVDHVETVFDAQHHTLRMIAERAIEITRAPAMHVDGSRPRESNAARVAGFLAQLLEGTAAAPAVDSPEADWFPLHA